MADWNPEMMSALVRVLENQEDPGVLTEDELVNGAICGREAKKTSERVAATELRRRGWTWPAIGKAIGVDQSTAFGWAQSYPKAEEE